MNPPADPALAPVVASIRAGDPNVGALEALGVAEPGRAAAAVQKAALHPRLSSCAESWLPPLLVTARPGAGADALVAVANTASPELAPDSLAALARVLGSSPFLARLLQRHVDWVADLDGDPPNPPPGDPIDASWVALRRAKYRGLLRIAARDLAGRSFEDSLRELSDLADLCLESALRIVASERGTLLPALFALGKLGGRELNFSSDVDLLFLYPTTPDMDELTRKREVEDFVRSFKGGLEERTEDGFGYRVDLDLRPEGRVGTLANSVEAALSYYESFGADWERQMLLRLRAVPGAGAGAENFAREIEPFVYRRLIGVDAIVGVRDMKARIESERRQSGVDLEVDLKEGPGGIRDVEFLVQALQLLLGGREPSLRTGNVLECLRGLALVGVLEPAVAESLRDAYLWLRRAEHALQLEEERQTHRFPRDAGAQLGLARRMGYGEANGVSARNRLLDDWTNVRAEVRRHFEDLVLRDADGRGPA
jgi:glutamate-ammonia-ligase adenylyltransferase